MFAEHDPAATAWSGERRQRSLCPHPDLPCASHAAELLYAVGVYGRTGAPVPEIAAARAERVGSLDPDIARVEREAFALDNARSMSQRRNCRFNWDFRDTLRLGTERAMEQRCDSKTGRF